MNRVLSPLTLIAMLYTFWKTLNDLEHNLRLAVPIPPSSIKMIQLVPIKIYVRRKYIKNIMS